MIRLIWWDIKSVRTTKVQNSSKLKNRLESSLTRSLNKTGEIKAIKEGSEGKEDLVDKEDSEDKGALGDKEDLVDREDLVEALLEARVASVEVREDSLEARVVLVEVREDSLEGKAVMEGMEMGKVVLVGGTITSQTTNLVKT